MVKRLLYVVPLLAAGCAGSVTHVAPVVPTKPGLMVYWPCLVDSPLAGHAAVFIDGKRVGEIAACRYRHFPATPGPHKVRFVEPYVLNLSGAMGFRGQSYSVPSNGPIFIRLHRIQYLEEKVVSEAEARAGMTGMPGG